MKLYLLSFGAGLLAGILYGLLHVRSPAPPVVALVGLLGILVGEQAVPVMEKLFFGKETTLSAVKKQCGEHMFGLLPGHSNNIQVAEKQDE